MLTVRKPPTAVVCEDDPVSRQLAFAALEKSGYRVVAGVDTVMDAARAAKVFQPDVMILDLMLPWVSGEYAISVINQEAPDCTIVICSSHDATAALECGAALAVPKGSLEQLQAVLWALASRREH